MKPLRAREGRVLNLMLGGRTVSEICETTGISRQTVWRIRKRPRFDQAFQMARSELLAAVVDQLRSDGTDYASTLHKIAMNRKARGSDRVQAARTGLDLMLKGVEQVDFEERLQKLEGIAGGQR
jgi:hypothetical protein